MPLEDWALLHDLLVRTVQHTTRAFHEQILASMPSGLVTCDAEGYFFLWGRTSDAIRSRGENVSAFEIEQECLQHADVEQAAAFGVPGDLGDEDVKVDVVLSPGTTTSAADLATYLRERLAPFMMPRYIQVRAELPTTATQKIEKYRLRAEGVGGAQYDGGSFGRRSGRA